MIALQAPAKVNLSLRLLGRRSDGYHELETLMVPLELADQLRMESTSAGIELSCSNPGLPQGPENLAWKAAALFFERSGIRAGVRIELEKHIPAQAGLGGGSSDAAAVLRGLNQLHDAPFAGDQLRALAAELGSDVAFFIGGRAAVCRGRGEQIEELKEWHHAWKLVLVFPPFGVSTAWAYSQWQTGRNAAPESEEVDGVRLVNDLETPVFGKYVVLRSLKNWLKSQPGVAAAMMAGSGSTIFAVVNESCQDQELQRAVAQQFGPTFRVCPTRLVPSS